MKKFLLLLVFASLVGVAGATRFYTRDSLVVLPDKTVVVFRPIEIEGRRYRWPNDKDSCYQPDPGNHLAHACISAAIWNGAIAEPISKEHLSTIYGPVVTIHPLGGEAQRWSKKQKNEPATESPAKLDRRNGPAFVWRDTNPRCKVRPWYVTFDGIENAYVECSDEKFSYLGNGCSLYLKDGEVLHLLPLRGDAVFFVPEIIPRYLGLIAAK